MARNGGMDFIYLAIAFVIVYAVLSQRMDPLWAGLISAALFTGGVAIRVVIGGRGGGL